MTTPRTEPQKRVQQADKPLIRRVIWECSDCHRQFYDWTEIDQGWVPCLGWPGREDFQPPMCDGKAVSPQIMEQWSAPCHIDDWCKRLRAYWSEGPYRFVWPKPSDTPPDTASATENVKE